MGFSSLRLMLTSLFDDLKQGRLNLQCSDLFFILTLFFAEQVNFCLGTLEEAWIDLVDDCEEPIAWNELFRLFVVWKVLSDLWVLVDPVKHILDGNAFQLVDVDVWDLGVEKVGFLTSQDCAQKRDWASAFWRQKQLSYKNSVISTGWTYHVRQVPCRGRTWKLTGQQGL
jgi:hypothetical protein